MSIKTLHKDIFTYNRNIQLAMISGIFVFMGRGIVLGSVFSVFVKVITDSYTDLGAVTTLGGLVMTAFLIPTGIGCDKYSRHHFLRVGSLFAVLGFFTLVLVPELAILTNYTELIWIFIAQAILGISRGLSQPSLESIIADSVESNKREKIYAQIFFLRQTANASGPALAALLFILLGDTWGVETMRQVMIFGAVFTILGAILQSLMHDKYSLGQESESIDYGTQIITNKHRSDNWWFVPATMITLGFIVGLGAGMTVRYFPLFFKEVYDQPPSIVQAIYALAMIATGLASLSTPKIAERIGKMETIFLVQFSATIALIMIAFYPPLVFLIPVFIFRNAFMNSSQPIQRSVLMDRVPKHARGKWNALQVLSFGFLWSISAGAGGLLLELYDFGILYLVTALLYLVATFPYLFLRKYVTNEESDPDL